MSKYAPHHRSSNRPRATASTVCQRCLQRGHFIYECKSTAAPYVSRPSRTELLEHPSRLSKAKLEGRPTVEVPDEFKKPGTANKILEAKEKEREQKKDEPSRKRARRGSHSSSSGSSSDSDSDSGSSSDSSTSSSGSDASRSSGRRRRVPKSP